MYGKCYMNFNHLRARFCRTGTVAKLPLADTSVAAIGISSAADLTTLESQVWGGEWGEALKL